MTTLTYVLATENGVYNPTVPWGHLHTAIAIYGRYKNVNFVRINDWNAASFRIVNAKSLNAWATYSQSKRIIRIHPTVNYGNNPTTLAKVIQHEMGHFRNSNHHNNPLGIMHPTAGSVFNWGQIDDAWWNHRPWRSSLRPWNEPNYFKDVFNAPRMISLFGTPEPTIKTEDANIFFGCQHSTLLSRFKELFTSRPKDIEISKVSNDELSLFNECSKCIGVK